MTAKENLQKAAEEAIENIKMKSWRNDDAYENEKHGENGVCEENNILWQQRNGIVMKMKA